MNISSSGPPSSVMMSAPNIALSDTFAAYSSLTHGSILESKMRAALRRDHAPKLLAGISRADPFIRRYRFSVFAIPICGLDKAQDQSRRDERHGNSVLSVAGFSGTLVASRCDSSLESASAQRLSCSGE